MSLCQGCGASYDDAFTYCPHCGRAKPEPESINLNVRIAPVRYEEAVLKMEVVGTTELKEAPFDYRPSGLRRALDGGGKNWTQITCLRLSLETVHPEKGKYPAFVSETFRGFISADLELPMPLYNSFIVEPFSQENRAHKWLLDLLEERRRRWDEFNGYLVGGGWIGLTEDTTNRVAPYADHLESRFINRDDKLSTHFTDMLMATSRHAYWHQLRSRGEIKDLYDFGESYRYRRLLR